MRSNKTKKKKKKNESQCTLAYSKHCLGEESFWGHIRKKVPGGLQVWLDSGAQMISLGLIMTEFHSHYSLTTFASSLALVLGRHPSSAEVWDSFILGQLSSCAPS